MGGKEAVDKTRNIPEHEKFLIIIVKKKRFKESK